MNKEVAGFRGRYAAVRDTPFVARPHRQLLLRAGRHRLVTTRLLALIGPSSTAHG
jgi:hypothetical protein